MFTTRRILWILSFLTSYVHPFKALTFPFEESQLTDSDIAAFPLVDFGNASAAGPLPPPGTCRAFPGTPSWPSDATWAALNTTLSPGRLLRTLPPGAVCYPDGVDGVSVYDDTACRALVRGTAARDRFWQENPVAVLTMWPQGDTCRPVLGVMEGDVRRCEQGGFPSYVVNVSNARDVQAAVNFARNAGVRLVVKNSGHDFMGRALGAGAIGVWTHYLKDSAYFPEFSIGRYKGPALAVAAGVECWELSNIMAQHNITVLQPRSDTVGAGGSGWRLGGGHTSLGSWKGLAADQILRLTVVTADGRVVVAEPGLNEDLFYALRGGGGATFGIVLSVVVKAYPAVNVTVSPLSFTVRGPGQGNFTGGRGRGSGGFGGRGGRGGRGGSPGRGGRGGATGRVPIPPTARPSYIGTYTESRSSEPVTATGGPSLPTGTPSRPMEPPRPGTPIPYPYSSNLGNVSATASSSRPPGRGSGLPFPPYPSGAAVPSGGLGRGFGDGFGAFGRGGSRVAPAVVNDTGVFWAGVGVYHAFVAKYVLPRGGSAYTYVSPTRTGGFGPQRGSGSGGNMSAVTEPGYSFRTTTEIPGMSPEEVQALLEPLFAELRRVGIEATNPMPTTAPYWGVRVPKRPATASPGNSHFGSRLFPLENFAYDFDSTHTGTDLFNATWAAIRNTTAAGYAFHGVMVAPTVDAAGWPTSELGAGANPVWRTAAMHADMFDRGAGFGDLGPESDNGQLSGAAAGGASDSQAQQQQGRQPPVTSPARTARDAALTAQLGIWRSVTPTSGAYMNEADYGEPDWQTSFFGSENYAVLLQTKRRHDPWGVFWAPRTVGSETWEVVGGGGDGSQNGMLCRTREQG